MKMIKAICTATVLALTLSIPAFAGDISTPGTALSGDISTPGVVSTPSPNQSDDTTIFVCESEEHALGDMFLALMSMF
jgi:hypothetical protein